MPKNAGAHDAYPTGQGGGAGVGVVAAVTGGAGEAVVVDDFFADGVLKTVANDVGLPVAGEVAVEAGLPDNDEPTIDDPVAVPDGVPEMD